MNTHRPGGHLEGNGVSPSRRQTSLAEETRAILRSYHVRPREALGQNFLIDREALESIVLAAQPEAGAQVLEIGPGIGTLTLALAHAGAHVHALELDHSLARVSQDRLAHLTNVTVHEGNILHTDLDAVLDTDQPYSVVANIPYYITEPILRTFLTAVRPPTHMVLMVQKEVGQRLAARPGHMSRLAVFAQVLASVEVIRIVPATSFVPAPAVDSAVVRLRLHAAPLVPAEEQGYFFSVVKAGFSSKRKMIHNALDQSLPNSGTVIDAALASAHIDRNRRAETLAINEWRALSLSLRADLEHLPRRYRLASDYRLEGVAAPEMRRVKEQE